MTRLVIAIGLPPASMIGCRGLDAADQAEPAAIALRTQEPVGSETPPGCPAALIEGVLVADDATGVALDDPAGSSVLSSGHMATPAGRGRRSRSWMGTGWSIARVGDRVRIGGGEITGDGAWMACGGVEVVP